MAHRYRDSAPYVSFEGGVAVARAFFGKHTGAKEITIIRSPSVSVEAQRSLPIHTDGEAAFSRYKASVEILEEKLHIIAG